MGLAEKKCIPCKGGVPPLAQEKVTELLNEIHADWKLTHNNTRLLRQVKLADFKKSLEIANVLGVIAEEQWHHPELTVGYGHLDIEIWTHKINALVESDFIYAAKCDEALKEII